jgi:hypothetical protein
MSIVATRLLASTILLVLPAFGQQIAFTSRTYVQSPVIITSVEGSKEYGFDSVELRNDGPNAISAIHFQIMLRTGDGDEVADERRVAVSLDSRDTRRIVVGLAQVEGLKQLARSRKLESALVILTIESVEFQDGGEWKQAERDGGTPLDPVNAPQELNRQRQK